MSTQTFHRMQGQILSLLLYLIQKLLCGGMHLLNQSVIKDFELYGVLSSD
ncbi:hypothetical protein [Altericista sp. CCNU0014]